MDIMTWSKVVKFAKNKKNRYVGELFFEGLCNGKKVLFRATSIDGVYAVNDEQYVFITKKMYNEITIK